MQDGLCAQVAPMSGTRRAHSRIELSVDKAPPKNDTAFVLAWKDIQHSHSMSFKDEVMIESLSAVDFASQSAADWLRVVAAG